MTFLDDQKYILSSNVAKDIYRSIKDLPLIDLCNYLQINEIVNNKQFTDIWDLLASMEHDIWELMRRKCISEEYITGNKTNKEKWRKLAEIFPSLAGNPGYERMYLTLKRILNIEESINTPNADRIWSKAHEELNKSAYYTNSLLEKNKATILCPVCDPVEDLKQLKTMKTDLKVLPIFSMNKLLDINAANFIDYTNLLDNKFGTNSTHFIGFKESIEKALDYFIENNCKTSNLEVFKPSFHRVDDLKAAYIYSKMIRHEYLTSIDIKEFQSYMVYFIFELFKTKNITVQLHIGSFKGYRRSLSEETVNNYSESITSNFIDIANGLRELLNYFDGTLNIIICISDLSLLQSTLTIIRMFPNIYMGFPPLFNNSFTGIYNYLNYITSTDMLSNFAGFASNARNATSIISNNEIFRRTLSQLIADHVERSQINENDAIFIANEICKNNPLRLINV
jgi:glucuronate isomerase